MRNDRFAFFFLEELTCSQSGEEEAAVDAAGACAGKDLDAGGGTEAWSEKTNLIIFFLKKGGKCVCDVTCCAAGAAS